MPISTCDVLDLRIVNLSNNIKRAENEKMAI